MIKKIDSLGIFLILVFLSIMTAFIYSSFNEKRPDMKGYEFRGIITSIQKKNKGEYDLTVSTSNGIMLELADIKFAAFYKLVKPGDSIVKIKNTDCFQYKRGNDLLLEKCEGVYWIEKSKEK